VVGAGTALGVARRRVAAQQRLCDRARGIRPEDRRVGSAPVGPKSFRRGQLAFVSPPAPVQFYKLPVLVHLGLLTAALPAGRAQPHGQGEPLSAGGIQSMICCAR
jgi:hypothetical protein